MKKTATQIADEILAKVAADAPAPTRTSYQPPKGGFGRNISGKKKKDPARTGSGLTPPSENNLNAVKI